MAGLSGMAEMPKALAKWGDVFMKPYCDITFKEKVDLFSFEYLKSVRSLMDIDYRDHVITKKLYSKLISNSHLLEDMLDFHGAKNNREWVFYRELTAVIRHLSLAGYSQKHILNRLGSYEFGKEYDDVFIQEARDTLRMIQDTLIMAAPVIIKEAERLKISVPEKGYSSEFFPGISSVHHLDHNIDEQDYGKEQGENITRIASQFLATVEEFEHFAFYERYDSSKIKSLVPEKINEVEIRRFEMLLHNLQSSFDSYVVSARFSEKYRQLKQLRSHFSIVFHMLQVMGRLLHFYERHLHDVGYKDMYQNISEALSELLGPEVLLDRAVNFCLFYAWQFLSSGKELAVRIVNEHMERAAVIVGIPEERGFHSRPSMLVAKIVHHYGGQVELVVGEDRFDASSVLDIQWAGGKIKKEEIKEIVFEGDSRALADIEILAGVNYGEDSMGKGIPLPKELSYLN